LLRVVLYVYLTIHMK